MADVALLLEDAYLYGACIEDAALSGGRLSVWVHYSERQPDFYELEPLLNLLRATLEFEGIGSDSSYRDATQARAAGAPEFLDRWERADQGWSLAGVAAVPGGFVIDVREAGEFAIAATHCTLSDVEPFAPDPHYAERPPLEIPATPAPGFEGWLSHQYSSGLGAAGAELPPSSNQRPSPLGGYYMVFGGSFGLVFAFCLTVLPVLARARQVFDWPVGLALNLFFAIIVYWGYRVLRRAGR